MIKKAYLLSVLMIMVTLTSCAQSSIEAMNPSVEEVTLSPTPVPTPEPTPIIRNINLKTVGDLMFHEYQLARSYNAQDGTFNFDDSFEHIEKYLSDADFTIGNLETTFGGPNGAHNFNVEKRIAGYSGYPCFNTPDVAAETLKMIGFDLLTTANNHSLDSKETGLFRTLDILDQNGILHVGTYRTQEEADEVRIVEVDGIKFAFVSFTYAMNGFMPSEGNDFIINSLDMYMPEKEKQICDLVKKAADQNPDFVVVMPHFGNEYVEYPNSYQENLVNALFESGADIILGSHPHVLQPIEIREIEREAGVSEQGIVMYSLGNFISSQKYEPGMNKDLGVIMGMEIEKKDNEKAIIKTISLVPTYTYWKDDVIGVLPVEESLANIENNPLNLSQYDQERLSFASKYVINHLMAYLEDYTYTLESNTYYIPLN